jgi:hypothetical protein
MKQRAEERMQAARRRVSDLRRTDPSYEPS